MGEDEFAAVFADNYRPLLGYALRRCHSPDDAADVVAETFAVAWRRVESLPEGDQTRLWLYGVARRVLANQRRTEQRQSIRTSLLREELSQVTTDDLDDSPVARVFGELADRDQELLALVAWEDLAVSEIAVVLGISRNAVSIRLHRARRRFAHALREAGIDQTMAVQATRHRLQESRS